MKATAVIREATAEPDDRRLELAIALSRHRGVQHFFALLGRRPDRFEEGQAR